MDAQYLTWKQFVDMVIGLLGVDGKRSGIETYRTLMIRQAVIQIQGFVDCYRVNHETIYKPEDLVIEGYAHRGVKPPQSVIRDIYLIRYANDSDGNPQCSRYPTISHPWTNRFELVHNQAAVNSGAGLISIDPYGYEFMVFPELTEDMVLSMHWDGLKLDFHDNEETPFDEQMAMAVTEFAQANICRHVDKDISLHDSHMISYRSQLPILYAHSRELMAMKG